MLRENGIVRIKIERADKALPQGGEERQRTAEKDDLTGNGPAAGKTADGLLNDGLENGHRNVLARAPFVQ